MRKKQKQVAVALPDRPMTDNELVIFKAAGKESCANTDTRLTVITELTTQGFTVVAPDSNSTSAFNPVTHGLTPQFIGKGRYRIGADTIALTGRQADVLQALVELRAATLSDLQTRSGVGNPSIALSQICNRYPALARFIKLAGGKGKGGYSTTILPHAD